MHESERDFARRRLGVRGRERLLDLKPEPNPADAHELAVAHDARRLRRQAHAADEGAVRAALVDDDVVGAALADRCVTMTHARIGKSHLGALATSDDDAGRIERNRRRRFEIAGPD